MVINNNSRTSFTDDTFQGSPSRHQVLEDEIKAYCIRMFADCSPLISNSDSHNEFGNVTKSPITIVNILDFVVCVEFFKGLKHSECFELIHFVVLDDATNCCNGDYMYNNSLNKGFVEKILKQLV